MGPKVDVSGLGIESGLIKNEEALTIQSHLFLEIFVCALQGRSNIQPDQMRKDPLQFVAADPIGIFDEGTVVGDGLGIIGCSDQRQPSLSKTAIRLAGGTKSGDPVLVTFSTKEVMAFLGAVSFQEGRAF